jgi:hypothetical protein
LLFRADERAVCDAPTESFIMKLILSAPCLNVWRDQVLT